VEEEPERHESTWPHRPSGHGEEGEHVGPEVSRRIRPILEAVEREVARLRADARAEARRSMEDARRRADELVAERQRRISELSDELIARAESVLRRLEATEPVRAAFEDLVRALGDAAERVAHEAPEPRPSSAQPPTPPAAAPAPRRATPPPPVPPSPPAAPEARRPASPDHPPRHRFRRGNGAQVVAIQMAAAGNTRADVESHIRESLGVEDPEPVLDEVFGPGTPGYARVEWARGPWDRETAGEA
jgi:hypothetical protein